MTDSTILPSTTRISRPLFMLAGIVLTVCDLLGMVFGATLIVKSRG